MTESPTVVAIGQLSGQLIAYEMLCQALISTHQDRKALFAEFSRYAKIADSRIANGHPSMRNGFDAVYAQIVKGLTKP